MKRYIFLLVLILFIITARSQGVFITAGSGGNWGSATTWSLIDGSDADGIPDADDDVYILSDGVNVNVNVSVTNLHIQGDAAGIVAKTGFGTTRTITISGELSGDDGGGTPTAPTENVFADTNITLIFTGTGTIITAWSTASPFENLTINSSGNFTIGSAIAIGGGAFTVNSGNQVSFNGDITNNGTFSVAIPAIFNKGSLQSIGGTSAVSFSDEVTFSNDMDFNVSTTFGSTVNAGSNALSFANNFTNNGSFTSAGTVTFDGNSAQSITGTSNTIFNNLTIGNTTATVTVNGTGSSVEGTLTLNANSSFNANGLLTIVSDASGTGRIATIPGTATFSGNVIYQRYIADNDPAISTGQWHSIASPVGGSTSDIESSGFPAPGTDLGRYNESVAGVADNGWETASGAPFTAISDTRGYSLWTRTANIPGTLEFTGSINTGNVDLAVSFTNTGSGDDGWSLVSNPYASAIDWGSGNWTKTNIATNAAVWNGNSYNYISSGAIASGQSFWVQATAVSPVLRARQTVKTTGDTFFKTESPLDELHITLSNETNSDLARILFREDATEEFDPQYDARKLSNQIFNFSSVTDGGTSMAISALPLADCSKTIKLNMTNIAIGTYALQFTNLNTLSAFSSVTLIDNFTQTNLKLNEGTTYPFSVTSDAASWGDTRFELEFSNSELDQTIGTVLPTYNCETSTTSIVIDNTVVGQSYVILKGMEQVASFDGTGSNITFEVQNVAFDQDIVPFNIEVSNECSTSLIENAFEVNYASLVLEAEYIDTNISVAGAYECSETNAIISIANTNSLYNYTLKINEATLETQAGSDGALLFEIATSLLTEGSNSFDVLIESNCSSETITAATSINYYASVEVTSTAGGEACGESSITLSATGAPENGYYRWYASADAVEPIAGENGASFSTGILNNTKTYFVTVVNAMGCESTKKSVEAIINEVPIAEIDKISENMLQSKDIHTSYQWYKDKLPIEGATERTFEVTETGSYSLVVSNGKCDSEPSVEREEIITALNNKETNDVLIYPNPIGNETLTIKFDNSKNITNVLLSDNNGKVVRYVNFESSEGALSIDFNGLEEGVYFVHIFEGGERTIYKVLKN